VAAYPRFCGNKGDAFMLSRRSVLLGIAGAASVPVLAGAAVPTHVSPELIRSASGPGIRVGGSSAKEIPSLLAADPSLNYVFVNYGVMGEPSEEAARVAIAFAQLHGQQRYLAFHQALFGSWWGVGKERALAEAERFGADRVRLAQAAASESVEARRIAGLRAGRALGLLATPSFIINGLLYHGDVGLELKQAALARTTRA
jgi:predicted DsbA family dithiol-disulfide isomerase